MLLQSQVPVQWDGAIMWCPLLWCWQTMCQLVELDSQLWLLLSAEYLHASLKEIIEAY